MTVVTCYVNLKNFQILLFNSHIVIYAVEVRFIHFIIIINYFLCSSYHLKLKKNKKLEFPTILIQEADDLP